MARKRKSTRAAKAAAGKNSKELHSKKTQSRPIRREIWGIVCLLLGFVTMLACFGVKELRGLMPVMRAFIGAGAYILPFAFLLCFGILMFHDGRPVRLRITCAFLTVITLGALVHVIGCKNPPEWGFYRMISELYFSGMDGISGGVVSGIIAMIFSLLSKFFAIPVLIVILILELLTSINMTVPGIIRAIRQRPRLEYAAPQREHPDPAKVIVDHVTTRHIEHTQRRQAKTSDFDIPIDDPASPAPSRPATKRTSKVKSPDQLIMEQEGLVKEAPVTEDISPEVQAVLQEEPQKLGREEVQKETLLVAQEIEENNADEAPKYIFPPIDLLRSGDGKNVDGTEEMRLNTQRLNDTLSSFNIDAHIINAVRGPSVTRYELELDRGVKLSKVTNLASDIALALGVTDVRISAIPDKISVVGIEVPNKSTATVLARDVIDSEEFKKNGSNLAFAVGRDIGGSSIVGDIAKMPHMLIAGTTGSGKSVCMNSLIISLLYKSTPEQVRMIMVDPKMVELQVYNGIPHLLIPVVTDAKKAAGSLQWAVCEMMRRYRMMASADVRTLESYNKVAAGNSELEAMPQIVIVIDELADLMLVAAKEVEESICRIAQMGRAAGIHLVIATQRPSADVITGLMKANIPSRIAFAVASAMESRIILDTQGAEKLIGKGDMLFAPLGQGKPKRVQGCFITDAEVQKVVDFVGKDATANYDNEVMAQIEKNATQSGKQGSAVSASADPSDDEGYDELLVQAVDVILETGQASVSMLQRRLKLGYARAARIVDEMEERGIVGPFSGSKPRELLVTKEQWEQMKNGGINPPVEEEIE